MNLGESPRRRIKKVSQPMQELLEDDDIEGRDGVGCDEEVLRGDRRAGTTR